MLLLFSTIALQETLEALISVLTCCCRGVLAMPCFLSAALYPAQWLLFAAARKCAAEQCQRLSRPAFNVTAVTPLLQRSTSA